MLGSDDEDDMITLSGVELYPEVWAYIQHIRYLQPVRVLPEMRLCAGVVPDVNGRSKPDILMAKRVADG
jgi:aminoglycoside 6'-N-acetyltransferase I